MDKKILHQLIQKGDFNAFIIFFDKHHPRILGTAIHLFKDENLATDVIEEIFRTLWINHAHTLDFEVRLRVLSKQVMLKRFRSLTLAEVKLIKQAIKEL